jgi:glycosyltransferase involved in cell wall biosynthesis
MSEPSRTSPALPEVSVVVPTHGRPALIARSLEAILVDPATTEVIVVVDGNDPETEVALAPTAQGNDRVRIAHASAPPGPRTGEQRVRDHGARLARCDVILALDDDIVADPGLVSGHAHWHTTATDLVVLGYMPLAPPTCGRRWTAATRLYSEGYEGACDWFDAQPESILLGIWGGNFSVRRQHWLRALQLNEVKLDFMHTDREFGLRLRRLGLQGRFDRSLRATHHDKKDVAWVAEAGRASAVAHTRLHQAYPEVIPLPDAGGNRYTRVAVQTLLSVTGDRRTWRSALNALVALTRFAYKCRLTKSESALTELVSRLSYERQQSLERSRLLK